MTLLAPRRRSRTRWGVLGITVLIVGLSLGTSALAAPPSAGTAYGTFALLDGSTFEGGDGNRTATSPNFDWDARDGSGISYTSGDDKTSGSTDNSFGSGTKEDQTAATVVLGSIPPNKNDLSKLEIANETTNGTVFVYLGWTRTKNNGNANLDFEINQSATLGLTEGTSGPVALGRTDGDILISYDFPGSGTPTLGLYTWRVTAGTGRWSDFTTLTTGTSTGATAEAGVSSDGKFGEAAVNLSALGIFDSANCREFSSAWVKSRSSSSFTAEVKDFIAPLSVSIGNCGTPGASAVTTLIPNLAVTFNNLQSGGVTSGDYTRVLTIGLYGESACTSAALYSQTFVVSGDGPYTTTNAGSSSGGYTISASSGTYYWKADYTGDSNNEPLELGCGFQQINIAP